MPEAFSDYEKEVIRKQILEKGQKLFEKQGLKKTTVQEITQSVGISKGAFYKFFVSKEELYMQILEQLEDTFHTNILEAASNPGEDAHQHIAQLLRDVIFSMDSFPILKNFDRAEYDYLVRKIPAERVQQHLQSDDAFMAEFIQRIERDGTTVSASPVMIGNLTKGLFFLNLHRDDLEDIAYEEMMGVIIHLVAGYITGKYNEPRS
jgi:AcrR family transcriptional regulator